MSGSPRFSDSGLGQFHLTVVFEFDNNLALQRPNTLQRKNEPKRFVQGLILFRSGAAQEGAKTGSMGKMG